MLRTAERIVDELQAWHQRNTWELKAAEEQSLARLLHELRALERGHDGRSCDECQRYAIDQLSTAERIAQADTLRVRMLRDGYPLPDVTRPLNEQIRQSLIAQVREAQVVEATGWTATQLRQRLWQLFPQRMQRVGKPRV